MYLNKIVNDATIKKEFIISELERTHEERDLQIQHIDGKHTSLEYIAEAFIKAGNHIKASITVISRKKKTRIFEDAAKKIDELNLELVQINSLLERIK